MKIIPYKKLQILAFGFKSGEEERKHIKLFDFEIKFKEK